MWRIQRPGVSVNFIKVGGSVGERTKIILAAGKVIKYQSKFIQGADQHVFNSEPLVTHLSLLSVWDGAWVAVQVGRRDVLQPWRGCASTSWGQGGKALES